MCPHQKRNLTQMCPFKFLGFKSKKLDLHTFVANSALSQLRTFWRALLAKIWWRGGLKHFNGPWDWGAHVPPSPIYILVVFGLGFVLEMNCLVVICHIQKDSWSLDDQPLLIIDRNIKVITSLWMLIFHKLLRPPALNDLLGRQGPSYPQTWRMSISLLPPCDSQPAPLAGQDPVGATWTGWTVPWGGGDLGETERKGWEEICKTNTRVASWFFFSIYIYGVKFSLINGHQAVGKIEISSYMFTNR